MSGSCTHQKLVSNGICKIKYCADCGTVHLMLGAMTLHLTADQFEKLGKSFRQAVGRKHEIDQAEGFVPVSAGNVVRFPVGLMD